jgi:hypothetical protein
MKLYRNMGARNAHRHVWNSEVHRVKWEPLLQAINFEWEELEFLSVLEGIRPCMLSPIGKDKYMARLTWALSNGLKARVVKSVKRWDGFANFYEPGDDFYVTAIGRTEEAIADPEANLGYPKCCEKFFTACYPVVTDPIWQWACGPYKPNANEISVTADPYSDPTLRYAGVRFAPHIPCSPQCGESIDLGKQFATLMKPELRDARLDLFRMFHSWDCYRSMAIVKTEPFRLVVGSAPAAERYLVNVVPG